MDFKGLVVVTRKPKTLLKKIREAIEEEEIDTWGVDEEGDFTHIDEDWEDEAWLHAEAEDGKLTFEILFPEDTEHEEELLYAVYYGRFIEMLLDNFDEEITSIVIA